MITNYIISYFESNCIKNIVQFRSPITKYCSIYRNLSLFFKKIQFYPTKKRKSLPLSASLSANACPYNERSLPYRGRERSVRLCTAERWCERTVRQLVARTPCPYRGLDDSRSFVRRRKVVQTRMRTPHPSAFGCHLPPLGKAFAKCEHRLKPRDGANPLIHCRDRRPRLSVKPNGKNQHHGGDRKKFKMR